MVRAFSNGPTSTPRHCARMRARAELLPGPRGGMRFIGGLKQK
jgi:hypothetical protein